LSGDPAAPVEPSGNAAPQNKRREIWLYLAFTLSGLVGLVYESTWTRYLQLFLGHAAYAQVLVLALFMGGMGAGALFAGRLSRTRIDALRGYATIEAALGFCALIFHPLFVTVTAYAFDVVQPATHGSPLGIVVQWLLAAAMILPQSVLLGMTFPLMSAAILRLGTPAPGRVFAMLYFTNSAGAVIGVLLAGFWLIERYGLQATMVAAGAGNLVVAMVAMVAMVPWGLSRRSAPGVASVQRRERMPVIGRWLLAFAFLTAVSSFLYEIAWLRMLALVQGASTHAFETMLAAFILGLALGGLWVRRGIERYHSPLRVLGTVQILMGLAALATLPACNFAFDAMQAAIPLLHRFPHGYVGYNITGFLISAAIMVPASFFAGMTLPLLTHVLYRSGRGESEIGAVYGWNTLGGIAGIAAGGLVLMPLIGLKNMIVLGAAIDITLGIVLLAYMMRARGLPDPRIALGLSATAIAAVLAILLLFQLDPARLVSGVFRTGDAQIADTSKVVYYADGRTATVSVVQQNNGSMSIATNGKPDAAIRMRRARGNLDDLPSADEYTMALIAALPLVYLPQARRVAIIGHGSGLTTHVLLGSPAIEHVDVIEIEPEMIKAARNFLPRVARAYADPRSQFHVEDARAFFARSPGQYDIIISEPSNPWVSGVASLFTPEFYAHARRALAPGGLFVQWFHLYETDRALVSAIAGGVATVFSDYRLYAADDADAFLVATASGTIPPPSDTLFEWPAMRAELAYLDIHTPAQLQLFRIASRRGYGPLLENGRVNSDYFPVLEFGAARARFENSDDSALAQLARSPLPVLEILSGFAAPRATSTSDIIARRNPRFDGLRRANLLASALADGAKAPANPSLSTEDRQSLQVLATPPAGDTQASWNQWFAELLFLSRPMTPNGASPALESFLRSESVAGALRRAPADVRDKVEFLSLVGKRDLERIRRQGPPLLAGELQGTDSAFHGYVLAVTIAACLAAPPPDADCEQVISRLDAIDGSSPMIDLLRAHQRTPHTTALPGGG
jgi:spermidine synthase